MYFVLDNFFKDPDAIREEALASDFEDVESFDGQTYKRVAVRDIPELTSNLRVFFNREVDVLGTAYRLNFDEELPNTAIHSDLHYGVWAAIVYLTDVKEGTSGTAFWKHKETGRRTCFPYETDFIKQLTEANDFEDESKWELLDVVDMKYNRALIMESALFHSRYPFKAFGTGPEDGRLIALGFFN